MIRKSCLLLPLALFVSGPTLADSGPGCGLGQMVFAGQSGLAAHVLAATTNGTSFNQLFGLSFDSLGCDGETVITAQFQRNVFVAYHYDNIVHDAAQGGGEHLQSLAALMNIPADDAEHFYQLTTRNYDQLFDSSTTDHTQWLEKLDLALAADPVLARYSMTSDS